MTRPMGTPPKGVVTKFGAFLPPDVLNSPAFAVLSGGQIRAYLGFLRRLHKVKTRGRTSKRAARWEATNADRLIFCYRTAAYELQMTQAGFRKCVDRLVEVGFIDIMPQEAADAAIGTFNPANVYAISDRYRKYGTAAFAPSRRARDCRYLGFCKRGPPRGAQKDGERTLEQTGRLTECVTAAMQGRAVSTLGGDCGGSSNGSEGVGAVPPDDGRVTAVTQSRVAQHDASYAVERNAGSAGVRVI